MTRELNENERLFIVVNTKLRKLREKFQKECNTLSIDQLERLEHEITTNMNQKYFEDKFKMFETGGGEEN